MEPMKQDGKAAQQEFSDEELLFRRFRPEHVIDGEIFPSSIRFNEPPSFCRERFAEPEDTIHPNCADSQDVSTFGVFEIPVVAVRINLQGFRFQPVHKPLSNCYAHSQVHCEKLADVQCGASEPTHVEPSKAVRNAFRVQIANQSTVVLKPKTQA